MISLGSSDARKGLGLGLGGGGKEMDTELEEGEACSYNNNNNDDYDDASVDPDIALSYIGEKVQDVLGHFQKDFEGGVSAENLGAKFGGYGSFLPTYQRSPAWSHPRIPPKAQSHTVKSPKNLQVEGGHPHLAVMSCIPQSVGPASVTGGTLPVSKALFMNDPVKQEASIPSNCVDEFSIKKCANLADQKTLKLRIKVGSDNLSTQKNAAIYSGLGLDVSPSSSMDNSPSENEGMYHDSQDVSFESPTNILQVMTSFPVLGDILLSPLPDNVLYLTKMERILKDNRSDSGWNDGIFLRDKRAKSVERNDFPAERKGANNRDIWNENRRSPKKDVDVDHFTCEELVSKTLKLPLLSNSYSAVDKVNKKGIVHNEVKDESFEPVFTVEIGRENPKSDSEGNVWEDKKTIFPDDLSCYPRIDSHVKEEKSYDIVSIDLNPSKGKKPVNREQVDDLKEKVSQRAISNEQESMKSPQGKEHASSGGKRKSKGNQSYGNVAADVLKESLRSGGSSSMPKSKKTTHVDNNVTKREMGDSNLEKPFKKAEDRYRDLFGDMEESEQEENQTSSVGIFSEHRLKETEKIDKSRPALNNTSKDRLSNEKSNKLLASEPYTKLTGEANLHPPNVNISETAAAPLLIEEWVCCDKCQKWRLLPFGMNVSSLPEKWLCSMLTWLPGMNRCGVSEEETTRAVIALYQVPATENQTNLNSNIGNNISRTQAADIQHPYQSHGSNGLHATSSGGRKKHGLKEISNVTEKDGLAQLSHSMKKTVQASDRTGSVNDVSQSPIVGEPGFQNLSESCDLLAEKHRNKRKEKHKVPGHSSDGGGGKNLKMKGKRHSDQDCFRAAKKIKRENLHFTDDDRVSDHAGAMDKVGSGSNCSLPTMSIGKDKPKHNESCSYKDSKVDKKERPQVSAKGPKDRVPPSADDGCLDLAKHGGDSSLKRKINEHDSHIYSGSFQGKVLENEEFSGNDCRKEKKVRVSKSESKDSGASKINGKLDRKGSHSKNHQKGQDKGATLSRGSLDGTDTLKRDFGPAQPSAAATSSSSKVSGSHKSKPGFQETKGSPVESVSSSPMRISNPDKFPLARRNISMRDESRDTEHFSTRSPRRYSNGDDNVGRDRSKTGRTEKTSSAAQHRSHEASVLDFRDKDTSYLSGGQAKLLIAPSRDTNKGQFTNGSVDYLGQETQYPCKSKTIDQHHNEERQNDSNHFNANGSHPRRSGKGFSHSRDNNQNFKPDSSELQDSKPELQDSVPLSEGKPRDGSNKFQEKFGIKSNQTENRHAEKKESVEKFYSKNGKRDSQANLLGHEGPDAKVDTTCSQDAMPNVKQSLIQDSDGERYKERLHPDKTDQLEVVSRRGNPLSLPPSGNVYPVSGPKKGCGDSSGINASQGDDASKVPRQINKADCPNGIQNNSIRQPTPGGHRVRDPDAPGSQRKDSSSQAMREATDLKHLADRFKSTGDILESTGLYFQAALKFLHGASLLESCTSESAKNADSLPVYSSTAKLCEYCAHEYEKRKEMAPAALAYKCMEVAYMRVVYSSHTRARGYRNELHAAVRMVPPGESPSSSASDVDNLNHPTAVDKVSFPKGVSSPQVAGSMVISARDRPSFLGLLNFAQDVNLAMEASRKSRLAFAAASLGVAKSEEIVSSVKLALDFNFQDIERLLHLIRVAMEAISR
ncbi:hypothetical protein SLEP1_g17033 [Rubroshorea leprosula]|uniref:CW-type domain-containing protein n=1 Tax=Rubroshorea leprosula TaxID=152421 RepID=A0AAV5ISY4_9ROSI|nr:hypothetical protein SLEP1_g17033 [Rubroshorea leprosula]